MSRKLYALLVGINDYRPEVGKLQGCLNDVDHFHNYLKRSWRSEDLAALTLKDGDATRRNIIDQFRQHLGRAGKDDVALFLFCGHGARWAADKAFRPYYPDGMDEGLVCIDSRSNGEFDLADKELAILLDELRKNSPHVAVIIDSCHAGSMTRDVDQFNGLVARVTHEVLTERPLESYLEGQYAAMIKRGDDPRIPKSPHILLAACDRMQTAKETRDRTGVFSSTLLKVLESSPTHLSYADVFVRCRAGVRDVVDNQDPQFETYGHFDAYGGFLSGEASRGQRRARVYFDMGQWMVEYGAIQGLPADPEKPAGFNLYHLGEPEKLAGRANTRQVGPHKSVLDLPADFPSEPKEYQGQLVSLPSAPILVSYEGDTIRRQILSDTLKSDPELHWEFTDAATRYKLSADGQQLRLLQHELDDRLIKAFPWPSEGSDSVARLMIPILKHVAQWERTMALRNPATQLDTSRVDFAFIDPAPDGGERLRQGEVTLDFAVAQEVWNKGRIKVRNRSPQKLHFLLAYCSTEFAIREYCNREIEPGETWVTLWGDDPDYEIFTLSSDKPEFDYFKLIVSTERVDGFLLTQTAIDPNAPEEVNRGVPDRNAPPRAKVLRDEWFTKDLRFTHVRQIAQVGAQDASLAGGQIVVKAHPSLTAQLSLNAAATPGRGVGEAPAFFRAFDRQNLSLMNFAATRGDNQSVLELTGIENVAALATQPLEIDINIALQEDEGILPVVFDGDHCHLIGAPHKDTQGITHLRIDHIPPMEDVQRGLVGSLKLYFLKTVLKRERVNQLRWVDYQPDGSFKYRDDWPTEKVATAKNVLLLIHGIIGDTEGMAQGVKAIGLDQKFDLILTYDYENLNTLIADNARALKAQLAGIGIREDDDKRLTLLVHSMGGLVSRWFIEREGGNKIVDHLVMCGTPNVGSPFGKINEARQILNLLVGVAMNYLPAFLPFGGPILFALNRSQKLTPSLEQMNPHSEFIQTLNASPDPGIPYTVLAGDIAQYQEPVDRLFPKLLSRIGTSAPMEVLFANKPHDIAVAVESILGVQDTRKIPVVRRPVACHHLNYFVSEAGQRALAEVSW